MYVCVIVWMELVRRAPQISSFDLFALFRFRLRLISLGQITLTLSLLLGLLHLRLDRLLRLILFVVLDTTTRQNRLEELERQMTLQRRNSEQRHIATRRVLGRLQAVEQRQHCKNHGGRTRDTETDLMADGQVAQLIVLVEDLDHCEDMVEELAKVMQRQQNQCNALESPEV